MSLQEKEQGDKFPPAELEISTELYSDLERIALSQSFGPMDILSVEELIRGWLAYAVSSRTWRSIAEVRRQRIGSHDASHGSRVFVPLSLGVTTSRQIIERARQEGIGPVQLTNEILATLVDIGDECRGR